MFKAKHNKGKAAISPISLLISDAPPPSKYVAVVAIDFGTTYSGYAYAFTSDPTRIQIMGHRLCGHRKEGHGLQQPTVLLLTNEGHFHSFGHEAQQYYLDMDEYDASNWLYFEKFKMELHSRKYLNEGMQLIATNGKQFPAVMVFAHSLNYFKHMCLQELRGQMVSDSVTAEDVQWVITVPAIWRESAKQFMRKAAVEAGLITENDTNQLIIALEPEAASIYCRTLQLKNINSLSATTTGSTTNGPLISSTRLHNSLSSSISLSSSSSSCGSSPDSCTGLQTFAATKKHAAKLQEGVNYMVADCGGGTIDLTVYKMEENEKLKELYKASGGAWGSIGVDYHFELLLVSIFGQTFIEQFIRLYPTSWLELMNSFEAKKRYFDPSRGSPVNISLPFSFVESFRLTQRITVEQAITNHAAGGKAIQWSSQGNLRLLPKAINSLFQPVVQNIVKHIHKVLSHPSTKDVQYIFLVGGFSESPVLQETIVNEFGNSFQIIIPQDVSLCTLKGAVMFGLDTSIVQVRHAALTYGVACLNTFNPKLHPPHKKVIKDGKEWCTDLLDTFVSVNQPVSQEKIITRYYNLARTGLKSTVITLFASEKQQFQFITDSGVTKVAELKLDMPDISCDNDRRELRVSMDFSKTEVMVSALDCITGQTAAIQMNFLYKQ